MTTIMKFMSSDHDRLDAIFQDYRRCKRSDVPQAAKRFAEFRAGLLCHIDWEESLLFPAFERHNGSAEGPTMVMRLEHRDIMACLQEIAQGLERGEAAGLDTTEEKMLGILGNHNDKEESILYPWIDQALAPGERAAMLDHMRATATP